MRHFYLDVEVFIVVLVLVIMGALLFFGLRNDSRLMRDCLADGNKEYVCRGLLEGHNPYGL